MATATKIQGKTSFVKKFLSANPQGNTEAVNGAWTAAGMKGRISHPVVSLVRKQLGLIGNPPGKTQKTAKAKSGSKMRKVGNSPGKSMFVKEYLIDHPLGHVDAVNEAWQAAGFDGTISRTVVDKLRALLGLTGNLRGHTKKSKISAAGEKRGRPRKETTAMVNVQPGGQPRGRKSDRAHALLGVEAEIDKLIFQVMGIGDLPEVETALREARRRVYGVISS